MTKEEYLAQRTELMASIEGLIAESKFEDSETKMQEVETLDNKWEEVKVANANLKALQDKNKAEDIENKSVKIEGGTVLENVQDVKKLTEQEIYTNAWAKQMMGNRLEGNEQEIFDKVNKDFSNAYTHTGVNTAVLIPTTVAQGIWARAGEANPLFGDAKKYAVSGKLAIKKHVSIDEGDAAWYTEATPTADEKNTFGELVLGGHELSKAVTVSWKLKSMAMDEFIPYIITELGDRVGVALGKAAASGTGTNQPQGVETALLAESGKPQVVTYDPNKGTAPVKLSYEKVVQAIGKLHSSYLNSAAIYATNGTIWSQLATLMDGTGRPLFIPDVTSGGVGRMFGMVVKPDAGVTAGHIVIGAANKGLVFNINEPFSVVTDDRAKARETDYVAYSIVDGGVLDTQAFVLIQDLKTP